MICDIAFKTHIERTLRHILGFSENPNEPLTKGNDCHRQAFFFLGIFNHLKNLFWKLHKNWVAILENSGKIVLD